MTTFIDKEILNDGDVKVSNEEVVFNPYNHNNNEIREKQVSDILKKYGVPSKVHNFNLYKRAFVHKSYCKRPKLENEANDVIIADKPDDCLSLKTKSNERLEFLGDGILEAITKYYLYRRFPKENEGFMTEKKIALVKNESIGKMAYEMGLNKWYIMSANAEEKKTRTNLKKLGCLFEAFLGALFLDFNKVKINDEHNWYKDVFVTGPGFHICQIFVEEVFDTHVNWIELLQKDENYKNRLQVVLQKAFKVTPIYCEINEWDEDDGYHMGVFLCINQDSHGLRRCDASTYDTIVSELSNTDCGDLTFHSENPLENISYYIENRNNKVWLFLGESKHKIKKKAEQSACKLGYQLLNCQ
jgi:dsRNA-specific ribonuclease|uniref:RNase III domain-containing protein n=1 Tax=viral metagenome TaxID=1070528 RepID=A0A6C0IU37_9ZZZZ